MIASEYSLTNQADGTFFNVPQVLDEAERTTQSVVALLVLRALNIATTGEPDGGRFEHLIVFNGNHA